MTKAVTVKKVTIRVSVAVWREVTGKCVPVLIFVKRNIRKLNNI